MIETTITIMALSLGIGLINYKLGKILDVLKEINRNKSSNVMQEMPNNAVENVATSENINNTENNLVSDVKDNKIVVKNIDGNNEKNKTINEIWVFLLCSLGFVILIIIAIILV